MQVNKNVVIIGIIIVFAVILFAFYIYAYSMPPGGNWSINDREADETVVHTFGSQEDNVYFQ